VAQQNSQRPQGEQISAPVVDEARRLARHAGITIKKAQACLERLIKALAPDLINEPLELTHALTQFPLSLFSDAIESFGVDRAVQLITEQDPASLQVAFRFSSIYSTENASLSELERPQRDLQGRGGPAR